MKEGIDFQCDEGRLFFQLGTGKSDWHLLGEKEKNSLPKSRVDFSEVLREVSRYVRENTPN